MNTEQASAGILAGGTIIIKTVGSSSETLIISKPMIILSIAVAATIGN